MGGGDLLGDGSRFTADGFQVRRYRPRIEGGFNKIESIQAPDGEVEDYLVTIVEPLDFGDAPDQPYPTLLANNGARHVIGPGRFACSVRPGHGS